MAFSLPVLGYYIKKDLQKGGHGLSKTPPGCALVDDLKKNSCKSLFLSTKALGVQDLESKASLFFSRSIIVHMQTKLFLDL